MTIHELIKKCREVVTREIPVHDHTHSLYVRCLSCQMFGINLPTKFSEAAVCGNCFSLETVKYYPPCCIVNDRESVKPLLDKLEEAVKVIEDLRSGMLNDMISRGLPSEYNASSALGKASEFLNEEVK